MPPGEARVGDRATAGRFSERVAGGRRRRRRRMAAVVAVLAVLLAAGEAVRRSGFFRVAQVRVTGTQRVTEAEVLAAASIAPGTEITAVDLGAVRRRVRAFAAVRTAYVWRDWPRTVRIRVLERVPAAAVRQDDGRLLLVDAGGVGIERVRSAPQGLVAVLPRRGIDPRAIRGALDVVVALTPPLRSRVRVLRVRSRDDIELGLDGGVTVVWGSSEQSARKVMVLTALLPKKSDRYDVSAPDAPAYR